jgi:hypothetical protein
MFSGTRQFEPAIEIDGRICWHLLLSDRLGLGFGTSPSSRENGIIGNLPARPAGVREVNGMRLCKGTTEGPRRVRQLDGAFLFGHERIVAYPDRTAFFWGLLPDRR